MTEYAINAVESAGEWDCPYCEYSGSYKGLASHFRESRGNENALLAVIGEDDLLYDYKTNSELELSNKYGISRGAVKEALAQAEADRRGMSEAATKRAEDNPEHLTEIAPLGTPARETNGMTGVTGEDAPLGGVTGEDHPAYGTASWMEGLTGQDNPNWRGGKSIYDSVKKQLHGPSWQTARKRHRGDECESCGESSGLLDLHHVVPLLAGGLNEEWNYMTLCRSCHNSAEWYTRDLFPSLLADE